MKILAVILHLVMAACSIYAIPPQAPPIKYILPQAPPVRSTGIQWRTDYQAALSEAAHTGKHLLIDFYCVPCPPCEQQLRTFADPRIIAIVNAWYVPLRINGPTMPKVIGSLGIARFPTVVIAAADTTIIRQDEGVVAPEVLLALLNFALLPKSSLGPPCGIPNCPCGCREGFPCVCRRNP